MQLTVQRRQLLMQHCAADVDNYLKILTASILHTHELCFC